MPFRPASAPSSHGQSNGFARRRTGLARTGNRVQFAGPETFHAQREKRLPRDPLPDSDEESESTDAIVTPSSRISGTWATPSTNEEVKWWHVPDNQIEDLIQQIEERIYSPDATVNLSASATFTTSASSPCHPSRSSSTFAASSPCRTLAVSGRPKLRTLPKSAVFLNACQTDFSATNCSIPVSLGSSEGRLDFSGASASSSASPQKPKFNSVSSAKNTLLDSRPPPFGCRPKQAFMARESSPCRLDSSSNALSLEHQRPSSGGDSCSGKHRTKQTAGNTKLASSSLKDTSAADKDLIEVELAFHSSTERISILIHPDALMGPSPDSKSSSDKASLKGMIAMLTGVSASDQRLLCRGFNVSYDHKSLRQLGIAQGSTITVYNKKERQRAQSDVVLACTAKLVQKQESAQQQASRRASFAKSKKGASAKIRPKWGWGLPPSAVPARKGWHATGQDLTLRFEDHLTWQEEEMPNLSGIRSSPTFTQPLEYMP